MIPVNGKIILAMHKAPFKFLGRLVYPNFDDKEKGPVVDKFLALVGKLIISNCTIAKKTWMYEYGVLPAMMWV